MSQLTTPNNHKICYAEQYGGYTDAAIQAAINDCPAGGEVYMCAGVWVITNPITISKAITLRGSGWGTVLQVASGFSTSLNVINIAPTGNGVVSGFKLIAFQIGAASGAPAQYGVYMDGTNGEIAYGLIDYLYIGSLGTGTIGAGGSGLAQGTPVLTTVQNCLLYKGITLTNCGDTVRILNNNITGAGYAINASFQPGASTFIVDGNNITSDQGIHLGTGVAVPHITNNEIETFASFTGSNGALIDIDGTVGSPASDAMIIGNSVQVVNNITAVGVRVNYANRTTIVNNRFGRGVGSSYDIQVTVNGTNTNIGTNTFVSGLPISSMLNDAGTGTHVFTQYNGAAFINNGKNLSCVDDQGAIRGLVGSNSDGTTAFYGFRGRACVGSSNGATYIFDGTPSNHYALAVAASASVVVSSATVTTVGQLAFVSGGGMQVNGVVSSPTGVVAKLDLSAQAANIASQLLYTVPTGASGRYRVIGYAVVTQAATTSSTLPSLQCSYTDADTSVSKTNSITPTGYTGNTVGTNTLDNTYNDSIVIMAKAGTTINVASTAYASSGATVMQYSAHFTCEYLGA